MSPPLRVRLAHLVAGGTQPRPEGSPPVTLMPSYAVMFRGLPACPCQVEWIPAAEAELRRQGIIQGNLGIAQMIGLYEGSGNTHGDPNGAGLRKGGGVTDFWLTGSTADEAVVVLRQMGGDPTWHRLPNWDGKGGSEHVHCGLRGCEHRTVEAVAQEYAVDHDGDGLVGDLPDPGPRPLSGRTWQQGIEWAKEQAMADENRMREIAREEIAEFKVDVGGKSKVKLPAAIQRLFERTKKPTP